LIDGIILTCNKCGFEGAADKFRHNSKTLCKKCRNETTRKRRLTNIDKARKADNEYRKANLEKTRKYNRNRFYAVGGKSMSDNKECSSFLGVHVAERVLAHVFKDVKKMTYGNSGYDFICNRGKKIDVKSSCIHYQRKRNPYFAFTFNKNKIADHFLCMAFDDRNDLNPLYIWLLPGSEFNHLVGTRISTATIDKWDEYRQPIDKALVCCSILKEQ